MLSSRVLIAVMCIALAAAIVGIARMEYAGGDVYPAYSSLRADPAGAKVFYEALENLGIPVERKYQSQARAPERGTTIFYLGIGILSFLNFDEARLQEFEETAARGNRVVAALDLGFRPRLPEMKKTALANSRWGLRLANAPDAKASWPVWFGRAEGWNLIWRDEGRPVGIERASGKGSIVLLSGSRAFSNRSMVEDRQLALLLCVVGDSRRVVFDETHLGIAETGSVLGLARRYRLQGLLWGLILFAAAFVWKNAVSFPPEVREAAAENAVAGFDVRSGLVRLLKRNIAPEKLIEICVSEWRKGRQGLRPVRVGAGDPMAAYRQVQQDLGGK